MDKVILCSDCEEEKVKIEAGGLFVVDSCTPLSGQDELPEEEKKCKIVWKIKN